MTMLQPDTFSPLPLGRSLFTLKKPGKDAAPPGDERQGLQKLLGKNLALNLLVFRLRDHMLLRQLYGEEMLAGVDETILRSLTQLCRDPAEPWSRSSVMILESGEYLLLLPCGRSGPEEVLERAFSLRGLAQAELNKDFMKWTGREFHIRVGHAGFSCPEEGERARERAFFQALSGARFLANQNMDSEKLALALGFRQVLAEERIETLYQPIVDMRSGRTLGWEALSRGPNQSRLRQPVLLFDLAEELGELFALEKICREKAIARFRGSNGAKLFLNVHPRTMADPAFTPGNTMAFLEQAGVNPQNVVLEITERHSVRDFGLFHKTLDHYRGQGFKVAVDDMGTGYANFATIAEIRPDYIKMDMALTRDIDKNPVKLALMETSVAFAEKIGSQIVAEGIETAEEAAILHRIGVHLGQGYRLGRPAFPRRDGVYDPPPAIVVPPRKSGATALSCSLPVGEFAEPARAVSAGSEVSLVRKIFANKDPISSVVALEGEKPVGLVMSYHLDKQLSSQYGLALYSRRPVSTVMDSQPFIAEASTPVEVVAQKAMARETLKTYDDVIVVEDGILRGTVTVRTLMDTLATVQVEMAKGVNPLTGLPGNVTIERTVETRIREGEQFDLVYADLDNFKVYNDVYGFGSGDEIIKLAARILGWAVNKHGEETSMLCHIGGDDFVVLTPPGTSTRICLSTVRCFKRAVLKHYHDEDRERGWIPALGRDGRHGKFPLVSISLGVLKVRGQCNLMEIGERAAHVKKFAKSLPGNSFAFDRRPPLGTLDAAAR